MTTATHKWLQSKSAVIAGVIFFASALFAIFNVIHIYQSFLTVPYWDFWDWLDNFYRHGFFDAATAQYNEHRQFFPSFFFALDQLLGGTNHMLETLLLLFQFATFAILLYPITRSKQFSKPQCYTLAALFLVFAFTFCQGENLFWPISAHTIFCNFCITLALLFWSYNETTPKNFFVLYSLIISFSILASFSFGHGIFIWPVLIFFSFIQRRWKDALFYLAIGSLVLLLYIHNYKTRSETPYLELILRRPKDLLLYMLLYLGRIAGPTDLTLLQNNPSSNFAELLAGVFGLTTYLIILWDYIRHKSHGLCANFFLPLMTLVVGASFLTALARVDYFHSQFLAARYVTLQLLFWAGVIVFILLALSKLSAISLYIDLIAFALFALLTLHLSSGWKNNVAYYSQMRTILLQQSFGASIGVIDWPRWKKWVYPNAQKSEKLVRLFRKQTNSFLSRPALKYFHKRIDNFNHSDGQCRGRAEILSNLDTKTGYGFKISGYAWWSKDPLLESPVIVVDKGTHTSVGFGYTGLIRSDVINRARLSKNVHAGFVAYAKTDVLTDLSKFDFYIVNESDNSICLLPLKPKK